MLRDSGEESPVVLPTDEDDSNDETTAESPPETRPESGRRSGFVATEGEAARVWFGDVDGADEARKFVANTDFDAETLYVETRPVGECQTLELCSVTWSDTDIDTQYGGGYRDADVSCDADARVSVSTLIRIPERIDPEHVNSHGSGWSSSGCRRERPREERATTEAPDLGPKSATSTTETAETSGTANTTETTEDGR
ncbi:hypothetical protein [Halorussus amylolyticus]|uniref:hypothetical protein n=1 Tax=Halorussus amylolyticus TaxID=1126242 RepID=UPI00192F9843|nr:hypothetical protein [Halorussus amylolyticus]